MNNLKQFYKEVVISKLMKELKLSNVMEVPKILKVTLNMGVGKTVTDKKHLTKDYYSKQSTILKSKKLFFEKKKKKKKKKEKKRKKEKRRKNDKLVLPNHHRLLRHRPQIPPSPRIQKLQMVRKSSLVRLRPRPHVLHPSHGFSLLQNYFIPSRKSLWSHCRIHGKRQLFLCSGMYFVLCYDCFISGQVKG